MTQPPDLFSFFLIILHILIKTTDKLGHELYLLCLRILHPLHNTSHLFPFSGKLFDGLTNSIIFAVAVIHASSPLLTVHFFSFASSCH